MSRNALPKAVLVAALLGTALLNPPVRGDWFVPGLLLFGLFNALVAPPGTLVVRLTAIAATLAALWSQDWLPVAVAVLGWLLWPPAYAVAWALGREARRTTDVEQPEDGNRALQARIGAVALIVAVAIGAGAYRFTVLRSLHQTAALFVGIPALLAIIVVLAASPRSATGVACKAVTVGMLVSLLFLGEGMLCVAMSAPLFYAVAISIAAAAEAARRRRDTPTTLLSFGFLLAVMPMSMEGVTTLTTIARDEAVTATKIVHASSDDVERALFTEPRFNRMLPPYLRAGFPRGVATRIDRDAGGMRWVIRIRGGEMRINGIEPRSGELTLKLEETRPGYRRWRAVSDTSHMTHYLTWQASEVAWEPIGRDTTKVTWTLRYQRGLDPAWYFGPWERYAARLAAGYLIDAVATP